MEKYDCLVLGGGPGGYVAAIRASQLGLKTALVEEDKLGGVCLNRGCIPTKALLKSAHAVHEIEGFKDLGLDVSLTGTSGKRAVERAMGVAKKISGGVSFLMKKNKITVIRDRGSLVSTSAVRLKRTGREVESSHIILATGASYRSFPGLCHDGKNLIGAWEAVSMAQLPKTIGIVGAGAIGVEFAYFWNAFGVAVHIFELQDHLLPLEDEDSSREIEKAYKAYGIKMSLGIQNVKARGTSNGGSLSATIGGKKRNFSFDKILIAVGMVGNTGGIGLESVGIKVEKGFIVANAMGQTNIPHIYAIGDVAGPPLLAHAASHEGVIAAEHMAGHSPSPIDPLNIPACTYCQPQVASLGYTQRALEEKGIPHKAGKIPFSANGKALASCETPGFVKVLVGEHGELLGAHIVGTLATELIHEYALFKTMEGVDDEMWSTVHPHPTLGEFLPEAMGLARGRALNY